MGKLNKLPVGIVGKFPAARKLGTPAAAKVGKPVGKLGKPAAKILFPNKEETTLQVVEGVACAMMGINWYCITTIITHVSYADCYSSLL